MGILAFISYATIDSEKYKISSVAQILKAKENIDDVLFWEKHMDDDIIKYMNDNIQKCSIVLLFCSPDASTSESVQMEWMAALKLKKKIIPVFFDEQDIPPLLTTKLGLAFNKNEIEATVEKMYHLIVKKQEGIEINVTDSDGKTSIGKDSLDMDIEELSEKVADAIFHQKKEIILGKYQYWVKKYKSNNVRYVDISPYRFLQQNPNKPSEYGKMAKEGHKVMWIMKNGKYFARWIDGSFVYMGNA